MKFLRIAGLMLVFAVGLVSILATSNGDGDDDDEPKNTAVINGSVTGSGGIADVTVSAGGRSATTDLNGFYKLTEVPVPSDGLLVLTYEKDGYATFQRTVPVAANKTFSVTARLLQHHYSEQVDAANEQNLDVEDPNNPGGDPLAQLSFPAGSLGSGNVTVNVAVGDPTTEEGRPTFPGDYMAATTQGGDADTPLESVVFTEITVNDANGDEITQVTEPVTVTMRLPDSLQTVYSAGDFIEWWSYDEINAVWIREDADPATTEALDDALVIDQAGVLYAQAKVTHFTWWNVDKPMDQHACLCAIVVDENDLPTAGVQMIAEGITYNGRSRPVSTGADGKGCVTVKRSTETVTEQIRLFVELGNVQFPYNVTDIAEGDVDSNDIFTPTTEGSTIYNTGQCVDLANNIALRYDGRITGKTTFEGSDTPVVGYVINTDFGVTATTDSDGNYELSVPLGLPVTLFAVGQSAETVTVEDANTPKVVNFEIANRDPVIDSVSRDPSGSVTNNQTVNLTVTAHDDDGDAIAYSWSTDQGSFNTTSGALVTWTAPAAGAGTATLTVTVTDGKGGETSQNIAIVYAGGTPSGNSLSFIFKDDIRSDQPVAGVVVALYNTDNRTIAQTLTSGADGIVDFGDIGRSRASFTFVYESAGGFSDRFIDTFVNMVVADDIVYYKDDEFDFDTESGAAVATVNYTLSAVPTNAGLTRIDPGNAWWSFPSNTGQLTNQSVLDTYLQDNGKLSSLALVNSASDTNLLIGYGFLLDQTVTEGATYDIALNRTPVTIGWTTQPATNLSYVDIEGYRDRIYYSLADTPEFGGVVLSDSGTLQVPTEFPVDYYWVFGGAEDNVSGIGSEKRYTTLPQSVALPIPDYSFSNVTFNSTTSTLSWTISGSTPRDLISIEMDAFSELEREIEWSILMAPSATSVQLMELPAPASSWINTTTLDNVTEASIAVVDVDFVSGIDELWQFLITGESFNQTANQILTGWTNVPEQDVVEKAQMPAAKRKAGVKSSADKQRVRATGLSKLRRQ